MHKRVAVQSIKNERDKSQQNVDKQAVSVLKIAQRKTDNGANVLADIEAGAVSAMYVTPGLDANMSITQGTTTHYYLQDGLNSVRTLTDSTAAVVNNYDYLPFGGAYTPSTTTTVNQRYTYTGRETNAVTPSMYYRNRQYNTGVGRFISRWPDQSLDPSYYIYQFNMPTMLDDPWGDPTKKKKPKKKKKKPTREDLNRALQGLFALGSMGRGSMRPDQRARAIGHHLEYGKPDIDGPNPFEELIAGPLEELWDQLTSTEMTDIGITKYFGPVAVGGGVVTCCNKSNCKVQAKWTKVCLGVGAGIAVTRHALEDQKGPGGGISGDNCPGGYEGVFYEATLALGPVVITYETTRAAPGRLDHENIDGFGGGLSGGGGAGGGAGICYYKIVGKPKVIGKCDK